MTAVQDRVAVRATLRVTLPDHYTALEPALAELALMPEGSAQRERLRENIIRIALPLAEHIARKFTDRGEPFDDLIQVARIGLVQAVDRYDGALGAHFVAFAVPTITGQIKKHFRDTGWAMHVPRSLQERHLAISRATAELSVSLGHPPSPREIAAHLGLDPADVVSGLAVGHAYATRSIDAPVRSAEDGDSGSLADLVGDWDAGFTDIDNRETVLPLIASLCERDRTLLVLRFFRGMSQTRIAAEMGISQMHVSRLLARTLTELRDRLAEE